MLILSKFMICKFSLYTIVEKLSIAHLQQQNFFLDYIKGEIYILRPMAIT